MKPIKVLSTRKLNPALHSLANQDNIILEEENLIRITFKKDKKTVERVMELLQNNTSPLIFTSANAPRALEVIMNQEKQTLSHRRIFCLSGRTQDAVIRAFPENHIEAEARNAAELASQLLASEEKNFIFFCGSKRRDELPEKLLAAGITVEEAEVYVTEESPKKLDDDFDAIMFFSPSAVSSFLRYNQISTSTVCFAIGETTAAALKEAGVENIITSPYPEEEKIFDTLINYFKTKKDH